MCNLCGPVRHLDICYGITMESACGKWGTRFTKTASEVTLHYNGGG